MKWRLFLILFIGWGNHCVCAQQDSIPVDSLKIASTLETEMLYQAEDSISVDFKTTLAFLYHEAKLNYSDYSLEAYYMEVDLKKSEVTARPVLDSMGNELGIPHFEEKSGSYDAREIVYNFKSEKGLVRDVITQQMELFVHGEVVKKMDDNISYIKNAKFTSCDLEHPHYDVRAFKAKVLPDDKIVMGAAMVFIEDIPTPLVLPFAIFPNIKRGQSGLIVPTFGQSRQEGFFLRNVGAYFRINDYVDMKLDGDVYTSGSFALRWNMNYALRYKFSGGIGLGYSLDFIDPKGIPDRQKQMGYSVKWVHRQDAKFKPNMSFSANVNFQNSSFSKNSTNVNDYLSNQTVSSINYSARFLDKLNLNVNAQAAYNTTTGNVNLVLPTISFSVDQLYPFKRKMAKGKTKWYETISFRYDLLAQNQVDAIDTTFLTMQTLREMKNGIQQNLRLASTVKLWKYLNWSNSLTYNEYWYTQNQTKSVDAEGVLQSHREYGFKTTREFYYNTNFSFKLYGIFRFKKGGLKAFRHVMTPNIGFSYRPDFSTPFWGTYATYLDADGNTHLYSKYEGSLYGGPAAGMIGSINFSLNNTFDMKVRDKKDTVKGEKNVALIDYFNVSTGYNFAADSLNVAPIQLSLRTTLFKRLNVDVSAEFDFYKVDEKGYRYNEFFWVNSDRKGLRFSRSNLRVGFSFSLNPKARPDQKAGGGISHLQDYNSPLYSGMPMFTTPVDFSVPWNLNVGYSLNYLVTPDPATEILQHDVVQNITLSGNFSITPKWHISFSTGFDIMSKRFTYTTINFSRDLHCWEMGFYWVPFGARTEWNFSIKIKSALLQDVKYEKRKDFRDEDLYNF